MIVRALKESDLSGALAVWNEVVRAGNAFPQKTPMTATEAKVFFATQSHTAVACDENGAVLGLYILHPNNIGHCGHIANASYAVRSECRGRHIGEALVRDCLTQAGKLGFEILQFNAVVASNTAAVRLYEKLGFVRLGCVPGGFRHDDGSAEDILLFYHLL